MIVYDTWGGENSQEHIARALYTEACPMITARITADLAGGYLVNLRCVDNDDVPWGQDEEFDTRHGVVKQ